MFFLLLFSLSTSTLFVPFSLLFFMCPCFLAPDLFFIIPSISLADLTPQKLKTSKIKSGQCVCAQGANFRDNFWWGNVGGFV